MLGENDQAGRAFFSRTESAVAWCAWPLRVLAVLMLGMGSRIRLVFLGLLKL